MPVVLHGDAAFSGQGIVPEVMEVSPAFTAVYGDFGTMKERNEFLVVE